MSSSMPTQIMKKSLKGGGNLSLARGGSLHLETASSLHLRAMIDGKTTKTRKPSATNFSSSTEKKVNTTNSASSLTAKARLRFPALKSKPAKNLDVLSGGSLKDAPTYKRKPNPTGAPERLAQAVEAQHNQPSKVMGKSCKNACGFSGKSLKQIQTKKLRKSDPTGALQRLAQAVDEARPHKRPKIAGKENPFCSSKSRGHVASDESSLFSSKRAKDFPVNINEGLPHGDYRQNREAPQKPVHLRQDSFPASTRRPQQEVFNSRLSNPPFTTIPSTTKTSTKDDPIAISNKALSLGVKNRQHKKKTTFAPSDKISISTWTTFLQEDESSALSASGDDTNVTNIGGNQGSKTNYEQNHEDTHFKTHNTQQLEDNSHPRKGIEALAPIPVPRKDQGSSKEKPTENFVKLNMRNKAGSCRGARNKIGKTKSQIKWENKKREYQQMAEEQSSSMGAKRDYSVASGGALTHDGVDPVDDLLDGAYASKAKTSNALITSLPLCSGHRQPCKQLRVKKNSSGNKGREFFCCAFPRGEQCDYFKWVDDTKEAVQKALLQNKSYSGFVARQVQSYMDSIKEMTVPELRDLARKKGLPTTGNRKEILVRLSLWTRNELTNSSSTNGDSSKLPNTTSTDDLNGSGDACESSEGWDSDDESLDASCGVSSDEELEISGFPSKDIDVEKTQIRMVTESSASIQAATNQDDCNRALKRYFGYCSFRPGQEWAIRRCLENKRSLLVAPTGSGKSLCYALPAAMMNGVCIVVSPLLSLIQDQIRVLPPSIPSASLSGQMSTMKMAAILDDISKGRLKTIFVSPEKLTSASFRRLFLPRWNRETNQHERFFPDVSLLCIDECHVLSQWGHNFRPSYLRLKTMVEMICPKSILAITATAGPRVVTDICDSLGIHQSSVPASGEDQSLSNANHCDESNGVQVMDSNRDNIEVACEILSSQEDRIARLISLLKTPDKSSRKSTPDCTFGSGSVIVYVWRQRDAEAVAENLNGVGIKGGVCVYHGGMESGARARAQSKFLRQKARVCVATVAFGLGINATFVEGIIHMYLPPSPESYLQEIGRAGRDGRQAFAMALVLQEEFLVRHSLAHTDCIAFSQVNALLTSLCKKTQESLSKIGDKPNQLSIGVLTSDTVAKFGFKAETAETLLSLLEAGLHDESYLRIDGFFYDRATLAPRRCHLDELVSREDVLRTVKQCGVCLEPAAGEEQESMGHNGQRQTSDEHGFGSFQFSVADCANCLGPNAEPRHVFAALRRLQNTGEIDFKLDTGHSGRGLNIRLSSLGVDQFGSPGQDTRDLALRLYESFNGTVQASASKVLHIDRILRVVSSSEESADRRGKAKSKTLCLFQNLMKSYFSETKSSEEERNAEHLGSFDPPPKANELIPDLEAALLFLEETDRTSQIVDRLRFDDPKNKDFAILSVTKFLHGLVPSKMDLHQCRSHHLFGRYQRTCFQNLHKAVAVSTTGTL